MAVMINTIEELVSVTKKDNWKKLGQLLDSITPYNVASSGSGIAMRRTEIGLCELVSYMFANTGNTLYTSTKQSQTGWSVALWKESDVYLGTLVETIYSAEVDYTLVSINTPDSLEPFLYDRLTKLGHLAANSARIQSMVEACREAKSKHESAFINEVQWLATKRNGWRINRRMMYLRFSPTLPTTKRDGRRTNRRMMYLHFLLILPTTLTGKNGGIYL